MKAEAKSSGAEAGMTRSMTQARSCTDLWYQRCWCRNVNPRIAELGSQPRAAT